MKELTSVGSLAVGSPLFKNQAVSSARVQSVGRKLRKRKNKVLIATSEYSLVEYADEEGNSEVVRINKDGDYTRVSESFNKVVQEVEKTADEAERLRRQKRINFIIGIL